MNIVYLQGTITRDAKAGGTYCFASIKPDGDGRAIIDLAAFDAAPIATMSMAKSGDHVRVTAKIGSKKDKQLTEAAKRDVWVPQIVVSKFEAVPSEAGPSNPRGSSGDSGDDGGIDF